ncbi:MAG TPA: universal stress protein [Candidatus Gastranaerophilales bacterium]|nr:universal stress protein [Candidatus Gastranaerophilales bacterium]
MKILYCEDFTGAALYSLKKALPFLKSELKTDIISVIETGFLPDMTGFLPTYHAYVNLAKKNKSENLEKIKSFLTENNVIVENIFYPEGDTADEIFKQIKKGNYDLIIAGSNSRKFFKKWLGSVSGKIAEKSPIPYFIAKKNEQQDENFIAEKKEIIFAVDGTENSYNCVKKAMEILNLDNLKIEILYVKKGSENFPPEILSDKEWLKIILKQEEQLAEEIINNVSAIVEEKGFKIDSKIILEGFPAGETIKYTQKNAKDLIALGSHGREGLASLLLGSVSREILNNINCPVLIIPTKKEKDFLI